jgi:hypothetical protein
MVKRVVENTSWTKERRTQPSALFCGGDRNATHVIDPHKLKTGTTTAPEIQASDTARKRRECPPLDLKDGWLTGM